MVTVTELALKKTAIFEKNAKLKIFTAEKLAHFTLKKYTYYELP